MIIFLVDISGKVPNYDICLCDSIADSIDKDNEFLFFCPLYDEKPHCKVVKLFTFIPPKFKRSEALWKRIGKLFETIINYFIVVYWVARKRPEIVHFQWFPLLEVASVERNVLKIMRSFSPHTKIVMTIHNVYPHNMADAQKRRYSNRFQKLACLIDTYIVHTDYSRKEVVKEFGLCGERVRIVHHGVFAPISFVPSVNDVKRQVVRFILFGSLSRYKGVDIFVNAVKLLPRDYQNKIHCVIAGEFQDSKLLHKLQEKSRHLKIEWYPCYLPDNELYKQIDKSNVVVLPYRRISQSGVLLLSLYFKRYIITSDLPSFKETLHGFTDDMFFESENSQSLANLIIRYVDGKVDLEKQMSAIDVLNEDYSWDKAAKKTIRLYHYIGR